jgi:hypothetical protein
MIDNDDGSDLGLGLDPRLGKTQGRDRANGGQHQQCRQISR